jgi:hypothetical protein
MRLPQRLSSLLMRRNTQTIDGRWRLSTATRQSQPRSVGCEVRRLVNPKEASRTANGRRPDRDPSRRSRIRAPPALIEGLADSQRDRVSRPRTSLVIDSSLAEFQCRLDPRGRGRTCSTAAACGGRRRPSSGSALANVDIPKTPEPSIRLFVECIAWGPRRGKTSLDPLPGPKRRQLRLRQDARRQSATIEDHRSAMGTKLGTKSHRRRPKRKQKARVSGPFVNSGGRI